VLIFIPFRCHKETAKLYDARQAIFRFHAIDGSGRAQISPFYLTLLSNGRDQQDGTAQIHCAKEPSLAASLL